MNCPSVRARNTGSGYVKPDTKSKADEDLKAKMAERAAQEAALWKPLSPPPSTQIPKTVAPGK